MLWRDPGRLNRIDGPDSSVNPIWWRLMRHLPESRADKVAAEETAERHRPSGPSTRKPYAAAASAPLYDRGRICHFQRKLTRTASW